MDDTLKSLKAVVEKEIRKVTAKGDITPPELEHMTKSLCLLEKIKEMEMMDMGDMGDGRSYGRMYPRMPIYRHEYSGHSIKDRMIASLEKMYDDAHTDHERQIVDDWIRRLSDK